ncbi:MAG: hypothetical protein ABSE53_10950 [Terracidiphilus sp.]|jgi:hypothetical protein
MKDRASQMTFAKAWEQTSPRFQPLHASIHTRLMDEWADKFQELQTKRDNIGDPWYVLDLVELEVNYTEELVVQFFLACCKTWRNEGQSESSAFFRSLWNRCLEPLLEDRKRQILRQLGRKVVNGEIATEFGSSAIEHAKARFGALYPILIANLRSTVLAGNYHSLERRHVSRKRSTRKRPKPIGKRDAVILDIIRAGYKGFKYCRELDRRRIRTPQGWQEDGCPENYATAYNCKNEDNTKYLWRQRIYWEKNRIKQRSQGRNGR